MTKRRLRRHIGLTLLLLLWLPLGSSGLHVQTVPAPEERSIASTSTPVLLGGELSEGDWSEIRGLLEQDLYQAASIARRESVGESFGASNPRHGIDTRFEPDGVRLNPSGASEDWEWRLIFRAYGYSGNLEAPREPDLVAEGNRIEYRRGPVVEWYVNDGRGLEQGFTLEERPRTGDGDALVIELGWQGSLERRWSEESQSILFEDKAGETILKYSGLRAWDSTGQNLPVEITQLDDGWRLDVDDRDAVYPVTVDPLIVNESRKLTAPDGVADDDFGWSVSIFGSTVVVGADWDDDKGTDSGSAYVFVRTGAGWIQQAKLLASDGAAFDGFGGAVAISGNTIVVGAWGDNDKGTDSGSAYVFVRSGGVWVQQAKLLASDGAADDSFGWVVSVSGDRAVIGAPFDNDKGDFSGSAYVFARSGGIWAQQAKLLASDGVADDDFAWSVSIFGDTVVVGADWDDDNGTNSGSAYVFVWNGASWVQQAKLTPSDGAAGDGFGIAVAVFGNTVVVGAWEDDDNGTNSGSAYVFVWNGASWIQQAKLLPSDGITDGGFGWSIAISGNTVVVGACGCAPTPGSAYVFLRTAGNWVEYAKLLASDGAVGDDLGISVSVSKSTALAGAWGDDDNGTNSGSAYIFQNLPVWGKDEVTINFGAPYGIWVWSSNPGWTPLHPVPPASLRTADVDGNGQDDVVIDFGAVYGIWIWLDNRSWVQLHPLPAETLASGDLDGNGEDDVIIDFGGAFGLWVWMNQSTWVNLHSVSPETMVTGDVDGNGQEDLLIDFGDAYGVWIWLNNAGWTPLHGVSPESMVTGDLDGNGQDDVSIDFGDNYGLWVWMNGTAWVNLHGVSPETMVTGDVDGNGQEDLVIDFGDAYGIWIWLNNASWIPLHGVSPESMATGDLDGNGQSDLIIDFGAAYGMWVWENNANWYPLHGVSPEAFVTGNVDGS